MHDEHADHAHHFLHGEVGVIEEGTVLVQVPLVNKFSTRRNWILAQADASVHLHRNFEAVPVHGRHFGELVFNDYPHLVALVDFDGRPWNAAVEAPGGHRSAWHQLGFHDLRDEVKFLDSIDHFEGQFWEIRHLYKQVCVPPVRRVRIGRWRS